ncbi:MAG: peptidylprolyl isomerase [Deinococcales bacterium]
MTQHTSVITPLASTTSAEDLVPEGYDLVDFLSEEKQQEFEKAEQVIEDGYDYAAIMVTNKGNMMIDLFEDVPITINNFAFLALHHYYEGIIFHRVLEDFMAQTGDPTGTGTGGPGYKFADEFVEGRLHTQKGTLSMANSAPIPMVRSFYDLCTHGLVG